MSLFKKKPETILEEKPSISLSTKKPNHPALSWKQASTPAKPDHLDNYVEVNPFARAEPRAAPKPRAAPQFVNIMTDAMVGRSNDEIADVVEFIKSSQFSMYWKFLDGQTNSDLNHFATLILQYLNDDDMFLEDLVKSLKSAGLF